MEEPTIIINGTLLSPGAAMTVRVAIEHFAEDLMKGLGDDAHGKAMVKGYYRCIDQIRKAISK